MLDRRSHSGITERGIEKDFQQAVRDLAALLSWTVW